MYNLVKEMQKHFGIGYEGVPRSLTYDEHIFRLKAFSEEIEEYKCARAIGDLEGQMDALVDLLVFTLGACEKHGFNNIEEAFARVMQANMSKERVENADESKRGYAFDLKKPEGWRAPYLADLVGTIDCEHTGLIILEGPDGCGKTTLAEHLRDRYGAHIIHSTWSPELEPRMQRYMEDTLSQALQIAKNQLVVLDRHWLSELIYADVYRGGSKLEGYHEHVHRLLDLHTTVKTSLIYCLPHDLNHAKLHFDKLKAEREEMYSDITDVINAYAALWDGSPCYQFKNKSRYVNRTLFTMGIMNGLQRCMQVVRYDWTADGTNMPKFITDNALVGESKCV